jgi:hypothetical protein
MKNYGKIYALKDPFTLEIRYIGFTRVKLNERFSQHKHEALKRKKLTHCYNWFRKCFNCGKLPIIELLEDKILIKDWGEKEQYWIDKYPNLTNQKKGGCGVHLNTDKDGRIRSIESKKIPIVQLDLTGKFIKKWNSIMEAELHFSNKYTGNIYRAVNSNSSAFNLLWIKFNDYDNNKNYSFKGKHWKSINLYCLYTNKLIKKYEKSSTLVKEFSISPSIITQVIKNNYIFKGVYYLKTDDNNSKPPTLNSIYEYNNNYYTNFNKLYRDENLPYSLGYQKQHKKNFIVKNVTENIIQKLRKSIF